MEKRALGKGIGALIPERESSSQDRIFYVSLDKIRQSSLQPREDFDATSLEELTQSIKEKGVIQPLLVRKSADHYELIAGERRWRAATALHLKEVPVIIKDVEDKDALELSLIENIQRQNLNPIEEARAYQYLMNKFAVTQEKISEVLGKARSTVANMLRLLNLPQEIQNEIRKGRITYAHGRVLLEIEDPNQQRRLVQEIISKSLSVRELENIANTRRPKLRLKSLTRNIKEPLVAVLEENLQHFLATKVRINKRKKRGAIVIEFYSMDDLQRIVDKMHGAVRHSQEEKI